MIMAEGVPLAKVQKEAESIIDRGLAKISDLTFRFVKGEIKVF